MEIGDRVTYHGSMDFYHPYVFTITKLFEWEGIECAALQDPRMSIWIARCRVSNLTPLTVEEEEAQCES